MYKTHSKVSDLKIIFAKKCLKLRHTYAFLSIILILTVSCGKVVNQKRDINDFSKNTSFLQLERDCSGAKQSESKIGKSIRQLYENSVQNKPDIFRSLVLSSKSYDYENPLILSLETMEKTYQTITNSSSEQQSAEELFYLFNESKRFEDQKCSFKNLADKKKYDIRPYLNIAHKCFQKSGTENCSEADFLNMTPESEAWARENTIELCKSFSNIVNCQAEYIVNQKKRTVGHMVHQYYERFQNERFLTLFKLKADHQKYNCEKTSDNKTIMKIKVLEGAFSHEWMQEVLNAVEATWANQTFAIKFELVNTYSPGVVTFIPSNKGISYVPDDNNRIVYVSTLNDMAMSKRVLAHEFGHVLGFPDCYIEFFDKAKNELVYYEISKNNTNIMCSLKDGVQVANDYFEQLEQNSCLFN